MTQTEILAFLSEHKEMMHKEFNVKKIGLFGSYANEQQTPDSDIDLLVDMPSNFEDFFNLKEFLELQFQKKIDLGLEKNIRELLKKKISREVIYA